MNATSFCCSTITGSYLETGFYYYGYRYYISRLGRWVNRDPIAADPNVYHYCGNEPLTHIDPLGLLKIKIGGYVFYVHENDPDFKPSDPHGHIGGPKSPLKVDVETGEIFHGSVPTGKNIGKKALEALRERLRGAGLICLVAAVVLETPDMVQAAEQGGASGVASHTGELALNGLIYTGESAILGEAVVGGAALAGTSVTVGGTTVAGVAAATGVGGAVLLTGTVAYAIGNEIGSTQIGDHTIHEHIGIGMYNVASGVSNAASAAWSWITDW